MAYKLYCNYRLESLCNFVIWKFGTCQTLCLQAYSCNLTRCRLKPSRPIHSFYPIRLLSCHANNWFSETAQSPGVARSSSVSHLCGDLCAVKRRNIHSICSWRTGAKQGHWGHWFRDFCEVWAAEGEGHGDRCGSKTHRTQTQSLCRITRECWPTLLVKKTLRRTWSLQRWNLLGMELFLVWLIWLCSSDWTPKVLLESVNARVTIYSQTGLQALMTSWVYMNSHWEKTNLQKK